MPEERYPADLLLTADDFVASGWKKVLANTSRDGYWPMREAFLAATRAAMDDGRRTYGKVLWILADLCSMMLNPQSMNEPFKPSMQFGDRRTALPDDLSDADVGFLATIVGLIDDPWLKARVADVVWLKQEPRDVAVALAAVDSYRLIPLDAETWFHDGQACWERAVYLARMLRGEAGDRLTVMEASIVDGLLSVTHADGFLGVGLSRLLDSNGLGGARKGEIAKKLEALAQQFDRAGNQYSAREYFTAAAGWFRRGGDNGNAVTMTVRVAETFAKEAVERAAGDQASHMIAAHFYEKAIQVYRSIPRADRAAHNVDERMAELRLRLTEAGTKSLDEMKVVSSGEIDISAMVAHARSAVRGKTALDALGTLTDLHRFFQVTSARDSARESIRKFPLQHLFAGSVLGRDGRVIAKHPGLSLAAGRTDDDETVIHSVLVRDYSMQAALAVQGAILPALESMLLEHRIREADFVSLTRQSPFVPSGHEILVGKALSAGYDGDFATALHLLAPQVENMVRFHLKQAGEKTTSLDAEGIENEIGLSALMELPAVERIFGEDLAFEISSLFCDPFGPNLRNEVAHGLVDDETAHSVYAVYAWWLGLKLVFTTYWNRLRSATEIPEEGTTPPPTTAPQ